MSFLMDSIERMRRRYPSKSWDELAALVKKECQEYECYLDECEARRIAREKTKAPPMTAPEPKIDVDALLALIDGYEGQTQPVEVPPSVLAQAHRELQTLRAEHEALVTLLLSASDAIRGCWREETRQHVCTSQTLELSPDMEPVRRLRARLAARRAQQEKP